MKEGVSQHRRANQWIELALSLALQMTRAEGGGVALHSDDGIFWSVIGHGEGSTVPLAFRLPQPFCPSLTQPLVALSFPETRWLPFCPPFAHVLLCRVGEGERVGLLMWVGRKSGCSFGEEEGKVLERFAWGLYHLLLPALPFYQKSTFLRPWLETSLRASAAERLEQSLTFLLELLLRQTGSRDGWVVLTNREGIPQVGAACGEGEQFLACRFPIQPPDPSWVLWGTTDHRWGAWLGVKCQRATPLAVKEVLLTLAEALLGVVQWSCQMAWLDQLVWRDPLTGLLNRRGFLLRLEGEWQRAARYGYPIAVLFADLDGFKPVNDLLGHPVGDKVLQQIARTLQGSVRRYDLVGRYGGDEFVVALPATSLEGALVVAERLRTRLAGFCVEEMRAVGLSLSVSIGVTVSSAVTALSVPQALHLADQAASMAKVKGRNRIEVCLPEEGHGTGGMGQGSGSTATLPPPFLSRDLWRALLQYLSHSVNNPVGGILGLTEIALQEPDLPPSVRATLQEIERLALRIKEFSHHLVRQPIGQLLQEIEAFEKRRKTAGKSANEQVATEGGQGDGPDASVSRG